MLNEKDHHESTKAKQCLMFDFKWLMKKVKDWIPVFTGVTRRNDEKGG